MARKLAFAPAGLNREVAGVQAKLSGRKGLRAATDPLGLMPKPGRMPAQDSGINYQPLVKQDDSSMKRRRYAVAGG